MDKVKKILKITWEIIRHIMAPELTEYKYDIIPANEIGKMRHEKALVEYIKSRRRLNEYKKLVVKAFYRQYKFLIALSCSVIGLTLMAYLLRLPPNIKLGDVFAVSIGFASYIKYGITILNTNPSLIIEEKVADYNLPKLKKKLRESLSNEWRYMDFHNKRIAGTQATIRAVGVLIIVTIINWFAIFEKTGTTFQSKFTELSNDFCEVITINPIGIRFRACDYITFWIPYASMLVSYMGYQFSIAFSRLKGSGHFFANQGAKPNYISSTYLDNLSLSVLNPSQNETI